MENKFTRTQIAEGVHFSRYIDNRFKINRIDVIFTDTLSDKSASLNAIIPAVLSRSSSDYPTMRSLNIKLSGLYSASLGDIVRKKGDIQLYGLYASTIDDRYAIDKENVLSETVKLLCGCLFSPYLENGIFPEKSVEIQKQNLIDANDAEINDKMLYSYRRGTEEAFKGEPASISVYGKNDDIRRITPEAAYNAYLDMLKTRNVEIICVGTNDFNETEKLLKEAFISAGRKPVSYPENRKSALKEQKSDITEQLDVAQSTLCMTFKSDYSDIYAMSVMCALFGGDVSSKLFTVVREKMSLCYYCFSRMLHEKGAMVVESGVEFENCEKAKTEILRQLEEISNGNFTDEDLEKIKRSLQNDLRTVNDRISSIANWYIGKILDKRIESPEEVTEKMLAVTREDVIKAASSMKLDTTYLLAPSGKEEDHE